MQSVEQLLLDEAIHALANNLRIVAAGPLQNTV